MKLTTEEIDNLKLFFSQEEMYGKQAVTTWKLIVKNLTKCAFFYVL